MHLHTLPPTPDLLSEAMGSMPTLRAALLLLVILHAAEPQISWLILTGAAMWLQTLQPSEDSLEELVHSASEDSMREAQAPPLHVSSHAHCQHACACTGAALAPPDADHAYHTYLQW